MLRVGYFSHTNITPSETFIYDQLRALASDEEIDLVYVSGESKPLIIDFNVKRISTAYNASQSLWQRVTCKLVSLVGVESGLKFELKQQKEFAYQKLHKANLPTFDVAYIDYATSGVLLMEYLEEKNTPFVVHVHGYDITTSVNNKAYLHRLKCLFEKASIFIAASEYMRRRLILLGCKKDKIRVVKLGVSAKGIIIDNWKSRIKNDPAIVFLGRLTDKKNPIALIHAFHIVKDKIENARLSILGGGPLYDEVKQLVEDLRLTDSVRLYGVVNREQSFPILNSHWIYAQHSVTPPSGDAEGFAISLAEAALHELPVVSTIHNGIPENVIDGKTGYLVPEYDYEAMAEKIIFLIRNVDVAERMGKAGRQHILNLCDPNIRSGEIKSLLTSCKKE